MLYNQNESRVQLDGCKITVSHAHDLDRATDTEPHPDISQAFAVFKRNTRRHALSANQKSVDAPLSHGAGSCTTCYPKR